MFEGFKSLSRCIPNWDISPNGPCPFYPGQRVQTCGLKGTVVSVTDGSAYVDWIASAKSGGDNSSLPDNIQSPNNLKLLNFSPDLTWNIGDVCVHCSHPKSFFLLVDVRSFVDVAWQDGVIQKDLPPTSLRPISDLDGRDLEYRHGNLVYREVTNEDETCNLSWFGFVTGLKNGEFKVTWADGTKCMVQPHAICVVDRDYYSNIMPESESDEDEAPAREDFPLSVESPKGFTCDRQVDLVNLIDMSSVRCLNQSNIHSVSNALDKDYREVMGLNLESIADNQLLIYIPFYQVIKLHSLVIRGPKQEGSKTVKLFINKESFDFSDAVVFPPSDTTILSEKNLQGKAVDLKSRKFQNVQSLVIFTEDNHSGSELTRIQKIVLYGTLNI